MDVPSPYKRRQVEGEERVWGWMKSERERVTSNKKDCDKVWHQEKEGERAEGKN